MEIYQATHQHRGEVNCLLMSGVIDRRLGNLDEAMASYERALDVAREIGWQHGESYLLGHLGNHALEMADYAEAGDLHRRALAISVNLGDKMLEAQSLDTLGLIDHFLGDPLCGRREISQRAGDTTEHRRPPRRRVHPHASGRLAGRVGRHGTRPGRRFSRRWRFGRRCGANNPLSVDDTAGLARIALAGGPVGRGARATPSAAGLAHTPRLRRRWSFLPRPTLTAYETLSTTGDQEAAFRCTASWPRLSRRTRLPDQQSPTAHLFPGSNPHHRALLAAWAEVSEQ